MNASRQVEAQRREIWLQTKAAVRDYARNPCRATEQRVETAIVDIRRLEGNPDARPAPKGRQPAEE